MPMAASYSLPLYVRFPAARFHVSEFGWQKNLQQDGQILRRWTHLLIRKTATIWIPALMLMAICTLLLIAKTLPAIYIFFILALPMENFRNRRSLTQRSIQISVKHRLQSHPTDAILYSRPTPRRKIRRSGVRRI